jgi:hypothetical protein
MNSAAQAVVDLISLAEKELFNGTFCRRVIKADLAVRPEKKSFYTKELIEWRNSMDNVISQIKGNSTAAALVAKAEKCREEAHELFLSVDTDTL